MYRPYQATPARGRAVLALAIVCALAPLNASASEWPADRVTGGFDLDPTDRFLSRSFYNAVFRASEGIALDWTGDLGTCQPGATGGGFKNAVLARVNFYRAMAGIPADIVFTPQFNAAAQEAALMMGAEQGLSHYPDPGWSCYTPTGADAAAKSNLSLGLMGWDAVSGQMTDNGANNSAVGHRRWLLYPQTQNMGTGDIPALGGSAANALWHRDAHIFETRPDARNDFVAWPPPGYVPYQIVPPRWSLSYPGADFSAATVAMTRDGLPVPVALETLVPAPGETWFIGEATLVWVPEGLDPDVSGAAWEHPDADLTYSVTVGNVAIGGQTRSFSYQVTVIDPEVSAPGDAVPDIGGPTQVSLSAGGSLALTPVPHAMGYEQRVLTVETYGAVQGAEGPLGGIWDDTSTGYDLVTTDTRATGSASFRLTHTGESPPQVQFFGLADRFVVQSGATLALKKRLAWATSDQIAHIQISRDDGATWRDLHTQTGTDGAGESAFQQLVFPLGDYVGQVVAIRFAYEVAMDGEYTWYSYTPQLEAAGYDIGYYLDDIALTGVTRVTSETATIAGPTPVFDFEPPALGNYGLQARAILWEGYPGLDWGRVTPVTVVTSVDTDGDGYPDEIDPYPADPNAVPAARIGVRGGTSPSYSLDLKASTRVTSFGLASDLPIVGDWDGDGFDEIGAFRPSNRRFYLDMNANGIWDGGDRVAGPYGTAGDLPVAGDWNGDGKDEIGVFRRSNACFYLDADDNGAWSAPDRRLGPFGVPNRDLPISGDWDGDGVDQIGVYRPPQSNFYLDMDGNGTWSGSDLRSQVFGGPGDAPVIGDWNGDRRDEIGVYRASGKRFYFDKDGDLNWSAGDESYTWGPANAIPFAGRW